MRGFNHQSKASTIRGEAHSPSPELVEEVRRSAARASRATTIGAALSVLDHDLRDALPRVAAPAMVIIGSRDRAIGESAASTPNGELRIVPGAGHFHLERPTAFEEAVIDVARRERLPRSIRANALALRGH